MPAPRSIHQNSQTFKSHQFLERRIPKLQLHPLRSQTQSVPHRNCPIQEIVRIEARVTDPQDSTETLVIVHHLQKEPV